MEKYLYAIAMTLLLALPSEGQAAEASTSHVFSDNLLSSISNSGVAFRFTYNDAGQLVDISSDYGIMAGVVTFDYTPGSKGTYQYDMSMKYEDDETAEEYYFKLGEDGFAVSAKHYSPKSMPAICTFEYNADGQLSLYSDGDETYTATYDEYGDIVSVAEGDYYTYTISYTDATQASMLENKGGFMLFTLFFQIEMDELEYAYFAGILGKPTKHLPVSKRAYCESSEISYRVDAEGYIDTMTFREIYDDLYMTFSLGWQAPAGIAEPSAAAGAEDFQWYTIGGVPVAAPSSGLFLRRNPDGSVEKVVVK